MMTLKSSAVDYIRQFVRDHAAIVVDADKTYLVESRLLPLIRQEQLTSLEDLASRLKGERFHRLHQKVVDAMTTNETSFFRDIHPFETLRTKVLPELLTKRGAERRLHVWCAASSSGQEPYSLAMLMREHFPALTSWALRLIASDLASSMLARVQAGRYSQLEINRGLPAPLLVKYFLKQGLEWQVRDDLRGMIDTMQVNLAGPWPALPPMDIIFLRNVLIYFDVETKKSILGKIWRLLRPDGYLFLGSAETTLNLDDAFERVQFDKTVCYRVRSR
jgi:chemotaxis protein methyltransferase CheR